MKTKVHHLPAALAALALLSTINSQLSSALGQGTAFSYEGQLNNNGSPATGTYNFQFLLYTSSSGGSAVAGPVATNGVTVSNGLFTVLIDFGASVWNGSTNWLEVDVESNGVSSFTILSPRQQMTPVPYAIFSETASNLSGTLAAGQLMGQINNSQLANNSVTVTAGTGLSGGGALALGNSVTLNNAGILSLGVNAPLSSTGGQNPTLSLNAAVVTNNQPSVTLSNLTLAGSLSLPGTADSINVGGTYILHYDSQGDIFVGNTAGTLGTPAGGNTALGAQALRNVTGGNNVAIGSQAMVNATSGSDNTAVGESALNNNSGGSDNTAVGFQALQLNISGSQSVAVGEAALGRDSLSGALDNTAVGYNALPKSTNGVGNTAVGAFGLQDNFTGSFNIALGFQAGSNLIAGSSNIYIGSPGGATNENNTIRIGTPGVQTTTVVAGVMTGDGSGLSNLNISQLPSAVVTNNEAGVTFSNVVLTGSLYLPNANPFFTIYANAGTPSSPIGHQIFRYQGVDSDIFIGYLAGNASGGGSFNTAVGDSALENNVSSDNDTAIGYQALLNNTGSANTAVGADALLDNTSSAGNTAIGFQALNANTGATNTANGAYALRNNTSGQFNTAVGGQALYWNTTGNGNIAVGFNTGTNLTTGSSNIYIGSLGGAAAENNTIRIGTPGIQTATVVAGVITGNGSGLSNLNSATLSTGVAIGVGSGNTIAGGVSDAFIGGGVQNTIQSGANEAVIGGGFENIAGAKYTVVDGGYANISTGIGSVIGGGGYDGSTFSGNMNAGNAATIGGGLGNQIQSGANYAFIGGGDNNIADGVEAIIAGGTSNTVSAADGTIGGGLGNQIQSGASEAFIGGGSYNTNSGVDATVGGGSQNVASGTAATVPGGAANLASGNVSFAAGIGAQAVNDGTFVWSDGSTSTFRSKANDQFLVQAIGGVGINKNNPATALDVNGTVTATAFVGDGSGLTGLNLNSTSGTALGHGLDNTIASGVSDGFIGGGTENSIISGANYATIGGGDSNTVSGTEATVAGGSGNIVSGTGSFIGGGGYDGTTYSGNTNSGNASVIVGGLGNQIPSGALGAFIGGGYYNTNTGGGSVIGGGQYNTAIGQQGFGSGISGGYTTVGGGYGNTANCNTLFGGYSTVGGGQFNTADNDFSTVGGGYLNTDISFYSTIGGGFDNTVFGAGAFIGGGGTDGTTFSGNMNAGNAATIGGGLDNQIQSGADYVFLGGGASNNVSGAGSVIGGGVDNTNSGRWATVGGGFNNKASGDYSTVPGGSGNSANGAYCLAAGENAQAQYGNCFVWSDGATFSSTGNSQFLIHAVGGVGIGTTTPGAPLDVSASRGDAPTPFYVMSLENGGGGNGLNISVNDSVGNSYPVLPLSVMNTGINKEIFSVDINGNCSALSFNPTSDRNAKENFATISSREVLNKVAALPISKWNFKQDKHTDHIGPMAQDFYAAFNVGMDDKHIATVDEGGVALAAIQGLNQKLEQELKRRDAENAELKAQNDSLAKRLEKIEQLMAEMNTSSK